MQIDIKRNVNETIEMHARQRPKQIKVSDRLFQERDILELRWLSDKMQIVTRNRIYEGEISNSVVTFGGMRHNPNSQRFKPFLLVFE